MSAPEPPPYEPVRPKRRSRWWWPASAVAHDDGLTVSVPSVRRFTRGSEVLGDGKSNSPAIAVTVELGALYSFRGRVA
jgi:hypothetical protein